jgi:tight adherence protein C
MWIWVSMVLSALSLGLAAWWAGRPYAMETGVQRQSPGFHARLLWPWVEALAPVCLPLMSWRMRRRYEALLSNAGMSSPWSPAHLCALQVTVSAIAAAFVAALGYSAVSLPGLVAAAAGTAGIAGFWPVQRLRERIQRRRAAMGREFPFMLDMITLCVEAGLSLQSAFQQAAKNGPAGPLSDELHRMLADVRTGMSRVEALERWSQRCDLTGLRQLVSAVAQAEQSGMSLGPALRAQSEQQRTERFLRAEELALQAPVKMMLPLVLCIFPCSFLIIGFPIAGKFLALLD